MPKPVVFEEKFYPDFDVEVSDKGKDIIYHFWPPHDKAEFIPGFAKFLELGFQATLPTHADVRAEFTSRHEAIVLAEHSDSGIHLDKASRSARGVPWEARETYYIKVVGGVEMPLADIFLKGRVFDNIEKAIRAGSSR
jgi:hypothetical protein